MGDVDFYIDKSDVKKVSKILKENHFISCDEQNQRHINFRCGNMEYEMHFEPESLPSGEIGDVLRKYLEDIRETSTIVEMEGMKFKIPDTFHHGLEMLLHMQRHLFSEGVGLRHLCDWAVLVNLLTEDEFLDMFEEKLKKGGLWKFAQLMSLAASVGIGLPYKSWMGKEFYVAESLFKDILSGGNFGIKDKQRELEGIFLSKKAVNGNKHLLQAIKGVNERIFLHWPFIKKNKIFLLFGWIDFAFRSIWLVRVGSRKKYHLQDVYEKSASRNKIYNHFHLFEVDGKETK